jgi:hypothetical protein
MLAQYPDHRLAVTQRQRGAQVGNVLVGNVFQAFVEAT